MPNVIIDLTNPDGTKTVGSIVFKTASTFPLIVGSTLVISGIIEVAIPGAAVTKFIEPGDYTLTIPTACGSPNTLTITVPDQVEDITLDDIITGGVGNLPVVPPKSIQIGPLLGITGFVGGSGKLDGVITVGQANTLWWIVDSVNAPSGRLLFCQPGGGATDLTIPLIVPLDHATSGNIFVPATT